MSPLSILGESVREEVERKAAFEPNLKYFYAEVNFLIFFVKVSLGTLVLLFSRFAFGESHQLSLFFVS